LASQIAGHFRFAEDWYRREPVIGLVLGYYAVLRSVWRAQPALRRCLTRCRHCGIFFLTHPRNAGRKDLRCPFGCRQAHRRRQSDQRSAAYYRDEVGQEKKRALNAKRRKSSARSPPPPPPLPLLEPSPPWPPRIVPYIRMVTSLLEGRPVSLAEVLAMLGRALRQHRMARMRRRDQTLGWLHAQPP
jgi:hypothetical protein